MSNTYECSVSNIYIFNLHFKDALIESGGDGYTAEQIFRNRRSCAAFTYDDLILMPGMPSMEFGLSQRTHFLCRAYCL